MIDVFNEKTKLYAVDVLLEMFIAFCKNEFGFYLYDYQREISHAVLMSLVVDRQDICIKISRQAGKTEAVTLIVRFLIRFFRVLYGRHCSVSFSSPKGEQAKTDVDRIKLSINQMVDRWQIEDDENNANTIRATYGGELMAEIFKFSLMPTTSNESKTLDISIVEEAHKADDKKRSDEIDPMLTSTNGFTIMIGVGCVRNCDFKRGCDGERANTRFIVCDYERVKKDREKAFKMTGDAAHLRYTAKTDRELATKGLNNPEIQRNYLLVDMVEVSDYISMSRLKTMARPSNVEVSTESLFMGIDWGKSNDRTVLTLVNEYLDIVDWIVISGIPNFEDQISVLQDKLTERGYIEKIVAVRGDSTGMGDMPMQVLQRKTELPVNSQSHIVFTIQSKNLMYTTLDEYLFKEKKQDEEDKEKAKTMFISYPADHEYTPIFEYEMTNLQRIYKGDGDYLSPSHKNEEGEHDDFCDSLALAVLGATSGRIDDIIFSE